MAGKPKPTKLKLVEGNLGRRPLPKNEPDPHPKAPECPGYIDDESRSTWKKIAPVLERMGLLTEVDGDALAILFQIRSRIAHFFESQKTETDPKEKARMYKEERLYSQLFRQYASEFGLTPRGRVGLVVGRDKDEDGAELLT